MSLHSAELLDPNLPDSVKSSSYLEKLADFRKRKLIDDLIANSDYGKHFIYNTKCEANATIIPKIAVFCEDNEMLLDSFNLLMNKCHEFNHCPDNWVMIPYSDCRTITDTLKRAYNSAENQQTELDVDVLIVDGNLVNGTGSQLLCDNIPRLNGTFFFPFSSDPDQNQSMIEILQKNHKPFHYSKMKDMIGIARNISNQEFWQTREK